MNASNWRDSFSSNAADLLQIYRWADGMTDEEFKHLLLVVFKYNLRRGGSGKINSRTVGRILDAREQVKADLREGRITR